MSSTARVGRRKSTWGVVRFELRFPHTFSVLAALILFLGITAIRAYPAWALAAIAGGDDDYDNGGRDLVALGIAWGMAGGTADTSP